MAAVGSPTPRPRRATSRSASSCARPVSGGCGASASPPSSPATSRAGATASARPAGAASLIAFVLVVVMYFGMLFSIGEMCAAMPHTGGAYSFARAAMGPWGGFVTGLAETIEYVFTTGVVVLLLRRLRRRASPPSCSALDLPTRGSGGSSSTPSSWPELRRRRGVLQFAIVVAIAVDRACSRLRRPGPDLERAGDLGRLFDIEPDAGTAPSCRSAWRRSSSRCPSPCGSSSASRSCRWPPRRRTTPRRDIPRAGISGLVTLVVCGAVVLRAQPGRHRRRGAGPGVADEPLLDGFRAFLPDGPRRAALALRAHRPARRRCRASCSPTAATCTRSPGPATTRRCSR